MEKQRVLGYFLRSKLSSATLVFGTSLPPEDISRILRSIWCGDEVLNVKRKTTSIVKRIRLFLDDQLFIDSTGEGPPPNNDTKYILDVLQGIPRTHIQEK